ncbi:uncharacterized protein LOC123682049 [Harmonia axyridis]|uniref:uncharacterized protein LOC123682049 n=1 Tax=Harmonia axyridis TaxID=115357 RepID=UPI001E276652|nr:uncharacterized protein LOC123682049 [Harmonia axyridis]XP_045476395.1 uncharacterized protein LOC123682049 [Harmonia axyridis]
MSSDLVRLTSFLLLCLLAASIAAKPSHFPDNQVTPDGDRSDMIDPGLLNAWRRYDLMMRRLTADYDNANMANENPLERMFRNPEMKRQGRSYRQCYFNPISCFKK